ncbi:hypothetical protein CEXT_283481 [Caerostris extrusa]|uniref:Uncharacterized protein n=1 Tax=Caerostris extrusa TaxID=172846 RepID=A0AAV4RHX6_CAEEX|nr:hypothetical protein CEXT_283481 [Caerostris extrusa]
MFQGLLKEPSKQAPIVSSPLTTYVTFRKKDGHGDKISDFRCPLEVFRQKLLWQSLSMQRVDIRSLGLIVLSMASSEKSSQTSDVLLRPDCSFNGLQRKSSQTSDVLLRYSGKLLWQSLSMLRIATKSLGLIVLSMASSEKFSDFKCSLEVFCQKLLWQSLSMLRMKIKSVSLNVL